MSNHGEESFKAYNSEEYEEVTFLKRASFKPYRRFKKILENPASALDHVAKGAQIYNTYCLMFMSVPEHEGRGILVYFETDKGDYVYWTGMISDVIDIEKDAGREFILPIEQFLGFAERCAEKEKENASGPLLYGGGEKDLIHIADPSEYEMYEIK